MNKDSVNTQNLQQKMNDLVEKKIDSLSYDFYKSLIIDAVNQKEFATTVFLFDQMKTNNLKPKDDIYTIINKLHSKTLPESKKIKLPLNIHKTLQPRRRIHKIMKGYNNKEAYDNAKNNSNIVKEYLLKNKDIAKMNNRIVMAKKIKQNCELDMKQIRFIITHLKRTKFFDQFTTQTKISNFFKT
tara:strand:- start:706 stop:1260 length:555 start_codon:yes stop_codon:yes gene_type:complete